MLYYTTGSFLRPYAYNSSATPLPIAHVIGPNFKHILTLILALLFSSCADSFLDPDPASEDTFAQAHTHLAPDTTTQQPLHTAGDPNCERLSTYHYLLYSILGILHLLLFSSIS